MSSIDARRRDERRDQRLVIVFAIIALVAAAVIGICAALLIDGVGGAPF